MADSTTGPPLNLILPEPGHANSTWGISLNQNMVTLNSAVNGNTNGIASINGQLGAGQLTLARSSSVGGQILFTNSTAVVGKQSRWTLQEDASTESGANAGSNFVMQAFDDNGVFLGNALTVNRQTQRVAVPQAPVGTTDVTNKTYVDTQLSTATTNEVTARNLAAPIGSIVMWASTTLPTNWTWVLGYHLAAASYPQLFAVIGTRYFWDGTNFGLPNLAGRMVLGYDGGGWSMGRLDGEYNHTLAIGEIPAHAHDMSHNHSASATQPAHSHDYIHTDSPHVGLGQGGTTTGAFHDQTGTAQPAITVTVNGISANTGNNGSSGAHNNMQPSIVLGYIIRCF